MDLKALASFLADYLDRLVKMFYQIAHWFDDMKVGKEEFTGNLAEDEAVEEE